MALIVRRPLGEEAFPQRGLQFLRLTPKPLIGLAPHAPGVYSGNGLSDGRGTAQAHADFARLIICSASLAAPLALVDHVRSSAGSR